MDLSLVEVPRWVKKPGASKRVETHEQLAAALEDGWVLRLAGPQDAPAPVVETEPVYDAPDAPAGAGEADAAVYGESEPDAEGGEESSEDDTKRGRGRPKKGR